ncbi:MAG: hypothetical protein PHE68_05590 [Candidatus Peribacteraceae bacterium]|nr:hypothetical protein [Candidatus Peribacteraceae bacterium]MDD5074272.1 hypothetical protein [Candidatus Peribacteraceae bacterium]
MKTPNTENESGKKDLPNRPPVREYLEEEGVGFNAGSLEFLISDIAIPNETVHVPIDSQSARKFIEELDIAFKAATTQLPQMKATSTIDLQLVCADGVILSLESSAFFPPKTKGQSLLAHAHSELYHISIKESAPSHSTKEPPKQDTKVLIQRLMQ